MEYARGHGTSSVHTFHQVGVQDLNKDEHKASTEFQDAPRALGLLASIEEGRKMGTSAPHSYLWIFDPWYRSTFALGSHLRNSLTQFGSVARGAVTKNGPLTFFDRR